MHLIVVVGTIMDLKGANEGMNLKEYAESIHIKSLKNIAPCYSELLEMAQLIVARCQKL